MSAYANAFFPSPIGKANMQAIPTQIIFIDVAHSNPGAWNAIKGEQGENLGGEGSNPDYIIEE